MKIIKKKAKQHLEKNAIEQLLGGGFDQILGTSDSGEKQKKNQETVLFEGQEISLTDLQEIKSEEKEAKREIEAGIDYVREIVHMGEKTINRENREIEAQLQEIMAEIKKLADSSKELQMQFKEIAVEQHVATPGKYHKSFFSWLLSVVRSARMKVEDSGAWLTAMHSKKKSREYGAMSKKHGTSFTLNNERTVATQVG
ncbi:MAG: hypothetical protein HW400_259 [Candidatus Levybacteria bacterium]|nr:hypothetical protein [Candidatus Levybacteria bacterium]